MWFANWDLGGPFWDKSNPVAQRSFANSPHKFVDRWNTPILITHGEYDFRILASQGMMAFNAARLRGVPVKCHFQKPVRAVTPGQAVVFYQNDYVFGGGTIIR